MPMDLSKPPTFISRTDDTTLHVSKQMKGIIVTYARIKHISLVEATFRLLSIGLRYEMLKIESPLQKELRRKIREAVGKQRKTISHGPG